jgi:hypothetical protein
MAAFGRQEAKADLSRSTKQWRNEDRQRDQLVDGKRRGTERLAAADVGRRVSYPD